MNVIRDRTHVPNAGVLGVGFVYVDPESKKTFVNCSVDQLAAIAIQHRKANHYPIGAHWTQDFIDNVCSHTPGEICFDEAAPGLGQKAKHLAKALFDSARSGFATVTQEQVSERLHVCETSGPGGSACEYYRGMRGLFDVACGRCGCTKLKMHLKTSVCPKGLW